MKRVQVVVVMCLMLSGAEAAGATVTQKEPAVTSTARADSEAATVAPSNGLSAGATFAQIDSFSLACSLMLQGCYYCCLGCTDLGFNIGAATPALMEAPVPPPRARAQAF